MRIRLEVLAACVLLTGCSTTVAPPVRVAETVTPLTTTSTPAPTTQAVPVAPCTAVVTGACVRLSTRQAWLLRDGAVVYGPVPIMPGAPDTPTPTGTFAVAWKNKDQYSSEYDAPMPNSVFFAPGGIAFHEGSLEQASHGCVHLRAEDAQRFFDTLAKDQTVQVLP
ncbi:hypothetical protein BC739_001357 [Kutzneria viridogrisea]|uniref:L,D-TPase catalytic domain-containing protein n=1 Tax=Kutzneria viridogrisea TaxID=47990 RepID=A0ABR6BBA1_9PSEU|nr:hypothetical protein [Kutzneria viridogrisea]